MIEVTTNYNGKIFTHRYEGQLDITITEHSVYISWFIDELPPTDPNELNMWRSNGFDLFVKDDIESIRGDDVILHGY